MAYHISKDGVSRQCRAKSPESCTATPSDQKEHYDTKEDAQRAYEEKMKNTFKPLKNSVERNILLSDNGLKKTGLNAYANSQEEDGLKQEEESPKRTSLDIADDHLKTSQQIEELIDYNNSNRKKDFVFKHNDPSYAEKTPKEKGKILTDLADKEDALKKEFDNSKIKNRNSLKNLSQNEIIEIQDKVNNLSAGSYLFTQNDWTIQDKKIPLHDQLSFNDESDLSYVIYEKNGQFLIKKDYGMSDEDGFKPITNEFEPDRLLGNVSESCKNKYNDDWLEEDDFGYDASKPSQKEFIEKHFVPFSKFLKERYNIAD